MASPYDLLEINREHFEKLDAENKKSFLQKQYEAKLRALNEEFARAPQPNNDAELAELKAEKKAKKAELEEAYNTLLSPHIAAFQTNDKNHEIFIAPTSVDIKATLDCYKQFVEEKYKDHPNKDEFYSSQHQYKNYETFKDSDYFKKLKKSDPRVAEKYNEKYFPHEVVVFRFDSAQDALECVTRMKNEKKMEAETADSLIKQIKQLIKSREEAKEKAEEVRGSSGPGYRRG